MSQEPPVKISVPPETPHLDRLGLMNTEIENVLRFLAGTTDELGYWTPCVPSVHGDRGDYTLCKEDQHFLPRHGDKRDLVRRAYGIDPVELEKERRPLLYYYRPEDKG